MNHINVGDRVIYTGNNDKIKTGYEGTVVNTWTTGSVMVIDIDWDNYVDGHTCEGLAKEGHGWNVYASYVKVIQINSELNPTDLKYINIIRKSKQLSTRFENKKKGPKYAF